MSQQLNFDLAYETKVFFELYTGQQYEGTFGEQNDFRVKIYDVIELPKRRAVPGYIYFYKKEIFKIEKLNSDDSKTNLSEDENNVDEEISTDFEKTNPEVTSTVQLEDFTRWTNISKNWFYISVLNDDFFEFLEQLNKVDFIALNGLGHNGRKRGFYLLAIATKVHMFIINVAVCGAQVFDNGLRQILEDKSICKIIFNGAEFNDCLYHVHKVQMSNFFDLQVADKFITRDKMPMRKLSELLTDYIKMKDNDALEVDKFDMESLVKSPPERTVLSRAIRSVAYFIPLKYILENKMLKSFVVKNNYCLNRTRYKTPIRALVTNSQLFKELEELKIEN